MVVCANHINDRLLCNSSVSHLVLFDAVKAFNGRCHSLILRLNAHVLYVLIGQIFVKILGELIAVVSIYLELPLLMYLENNFTKLSLR